MRTKMPVLQRPEKVADELHRAKDALDRIWSIVEFDGRVSDDIVDEIDQVIRAYRYGEGVRK